MISAFELFDTFRRPGIIGSDLGRSLGISLGISWGEVGAPWGGAERWKVYSGEHGLASW